MIIRGVRIIRTFYYFYHYVPQLKCYVIYEEIPSLEVTRVLGTVDNVLQAHKVCVELAQQMNVFVLKAKLKNVA